MTMVYYGRPIGRALDPVNRATGSLLREEAALLIVLVLRAWAK